MPVPLSEFVLEYKMQCDRIMTNSGSDMFKVCTIFSLSMDYAQAMKANHNAVTTNDIMVWGALFTRYMKQLE